MNPKNIFLTAIILISFFSVTLSVNATPELRKDELLNPGTTPDSPFYFLKTWKESIQTFFTFGLENKARQYLHLAEIRLAEYQKMIDKGKTKVAEKTLAKYERQLNRALGKAEQMKQKGKDVKDISQKLEDKIAKHVEVLEKNLQKVPEAGKKGIEKAIESSGKATEKIKEKLKEPKDETKVNWESLIPSIRTVLKQAFPGIGIENPYPISIGNKVDITGDGVPEAFVDPGTGGAATLYVALVKIENDKPIVPLFKQKDGKVSTLMFTAGAGGSGRYGSTVEALPNKNAVYQASYLKYGESSDYCSVEAYQWNAQTKTFEFNLDLSNEIQQDYCRNR